MPPLIRERSLDRFEVDALGSQLERSDRGCRIPARAAGDPSSTRPPPPARRCSGAGTGARGPGPVPLAALATPSGCRGSSRRRSRRSCRGRRRGSGPASPPRSRPGSPPRWCAAGRIRSPSRPLQGSAGGGRADRSSLPLGESGNASRKTYDDGTIGSGIRSLQPAPQVRRRRGGKRLSGTT